MFPVRFCGFWSLIACTDPSYIGSELVIDYNTIKFTPIKRYGFIKVKKNIYGSVFLREQNKTKIAWLPTVNYDIETQIIPRITIPLKHKCSKMMVSYDIDPTANWITIQTHLDQYVFRRELVSPSKNDSILKIFLTQLLFDYIIRNIHPN
jgi:hypothetical protein